MEVRDKIINYWVTLYPELDKPEDIDSLIKSSFGESMNDLLGRMENNHFYNKDETLKLIDDVFSLSIHEQLPAFEERCKIDVKYYNFFRPIVNYCYWRFYDKAKSIGPQINFDDIVMNCLEDISQYAAKLLVLDVNYMKESGELKGSTPKERHLYYEDTILGDAESVKELYENYYEYARLALKMTDLCSEYCIDILKNFKKDEAELRDKLGIKGQEDVEISSIRLGSGDRHNGKSVAQIKLTNDVQLLYKPHSLELDRDFYDLITWINKNKSEDMLDLKAAESISFDDYSWAFFVEHDEVNSQGSVNKYFHRAGQLLGIMYMLNGVDCHNENIIANGEYPVLIDTETLIHPVIKGRENGNTRTLDSIEKNFMDYIGKATLSTGLLPLFVIGNEEDSERVDISGFSSVGDSKYPFKSIEFVNADSDEVRLERAYRPMPEEKNCPVYKGKIYDGLNYKEDIIKGFSAMYDWVLCNREAIITYIRGHFKDATIRVLMRATNIYGRLLETSVHPDFLSDDISRRVVLARLAINTTKEYKNIVPYECESMLENDIPYFTCSLGDKHVDCNGHSVEGMLKESPIDSVEKKIRSFSQRDKHQQIHYIEVAYKLKESAYEADGSALTFSENGDAINLYSRQDYMDFAKKVGDYLLEYSVEMDVDGNKIIGWLTSVLKGHSDKLCDVGFPSYNLYEGISGIGLFLLELAKQTSEEKYKAAARKCVRAIQYKVNLLKDEEITALGSYNGVSGYVLLLYDALKYFNEPDIESDFNLILKKINDNVERSMFYDIVQGDAGCIQVLNYIYRDTKEYQYQEKALAIIDSLVKKMYRNLFKDDGEKLIWVGAEDINIYSGYAHGCAGITAQLARVRDILDKELIDKMITAALVYERSFFDQEIENWYTKIGTTEVGNGWCHGSPGILLEKCILKESGYRDRLLDYEFELALKNSIATSLGCTHCYCHGDIGNIEIIYRAAELIGDGALMKRCLATYNLSLKNSLSKKYNGESFRGGDVVGLMLGSAGFGYSALKNAKPEKIKGLLTF